MIRPQRLGQVNITVRAMSLDRSESACGTEDVMSSDVGARDAITQPLLVEAEGVEKYYSITWLVCPNDEADGVFTDVMDLDLPPEDVVPGKSCRLHTHAHTHTRTICAGIHFTTAEFAQPTYMQ